MYQIHHVHQGLVLLGSRPYDHTTPQTPAIVDTVEYGAKQCISHPQSQFTLSASITSCRARALADFTDTILDLWPLAAHDDSS